MRDQNTVAGIINALRQVHGDDIARVTVERRIIIGRSDELRAALPIEKPDAVKLINRALRTS